MRRPLSRGTPVRPALSMHRRDRLVPILCATLFVVGVLVQLVAGRGFELSGLPVDAELVIVGARTPRHAQCT